MPTLVLIALHLTNDAARRLRRLFVAPRVRNLSSVFSECPHSLDQSGGCCIPGMLHSLLDANDQPHSPHHRIGGSKRPPSQAARKRLWAQRHRVLSAVGAPDRARQFAALAVQRAGTATDVRYAAERVGISRRQLSRLCQRTFESSPATVLKLARISSAADDLRMTGAKLSAISERHGFADEYTFSRQFLRITGIRPGEYRKRHALRMSRSAIRDVPIGH